MFRKKPLLFHLILSLGLLSLAGCILGSPVYSPSGRRSPDNLAVRAESKAVLFTLLMRQVNVSRSNGLAWVSRRDAKNYADYKTRMQGLLRERLNFDLVADKDLLDTPAYLAGRFPVRQKFFLNPDLLPIVRQEEDQNLMLRLGRSLQADYFVTALVDHEINKTLFFSPRVKALVSLNLYSYHGGFIGAYEQSESMAVECPTGDGPANQVCAAAINKALDRATDRAFAAMNKDLTAIQVRRKGEALPVTEQPAARDKDLEKFPQPEKKKKFKYIRR